MKSQHLINCSCGWVAVPLGLGTATGSVVMLSLPEIGDHWSNGHKVTARTIETWDMVRSAAIDYARAQGVKVNSSRIPVAPRYEARDLRSDLDAAIKSGDLREAMRIAMEIRSGGAPRRRADWPW